MLPLQSGDAAFKDLLSSVVDTDVWQQAQKRLDTAGPAEHHPKLLP
jgi:hypothetical protein